MNESSAAGGRKRDASEAQKQGARDLTLKESQFATMFQECVPKGRSEKQNEAKKTNKIKKYLYADLAHLVVNESSAAGGRKRNAREAQKQGARDLTLKESQFATMFQECAPKGRSEKQNEAKKTNKIKKYLYADLAHLVERHLAKVEVAGSSPVIRSKEKSTRVVLFSLELVGAVPPCGTKPSSSCGSPCKCPPCLRRASRA